MRKIALIVVISLFAIPLHHHSRVNAQTSKAPSSVEQNSATNGGNAAASETGTQTMKQEAAPARITEYTLSPERDKKARALSAVHLRMLVVNLIYGLVVLLVVLRLKLAPKFRDIAEKVSSKRVLQALIFAPLITLAIDILSLPTGIYGNWIERVYGLSIQGWPSWFWDWTKGEFLSVILSFVVVWILYSVIRKSPKRWWFYFWLAALPLIAALIFMQPLIVDPMFHKFEPLQVKDPALTAELEKMVQHAGKDIPPERMFWMGAGEKTTTLNAYVTGFGASKRIVVWDTTIAKMNTPQIVFVAGHEMGHYVLGHIPKGFAFLAVLLLVIFYIGYRTIGWVLAKWGPQWGIRELGDWASYPALFCCFRLSRWLQAQSEAHSPDTRSIRQTNTDWKLPMD